MLLFVVLLRCFICVGTIQIYRTDMSSIICYSHKFIGFMFIYYTIKLNIILFYMVFSYLYLGSIDLLKILINNIIFYFKKN